MAEYPNLHMVATIESSGEHVRGVAGRADRVAINLAHCPCPPAVVPLSYRVSATVHPEGLRVAFARVMESGRPDILAVDEISRDSIELRALEETLFGIRR